MADSPRFPTLGMVIAAGGGGVRYGGKNNKLLEILAGIPVILHSVRRFAPLLAPGCCVVVAPPEVRAALADCPVRFADPGSNRVESVRHGVAALPKTVGLIAIHDAARPLASAALLERLVAEAEKIGGAVPGKMPIDTIAGITPDGRLAQAPLARAALFAVETPQVFQAASYRRALEQANAAAFTDDAGIFTAAGGSVAAVANPEPNLKLTVAADLPLLAALLATARPTLSD